MGYGELEKQGRSFLFTVNIGGNVDPSLTSLLTTEIDTSTGLEVDCWQVDTPSHFPVNNQFSTEIDPQPPTVDRSIPEIIKHDDWIEYKVSGDRIEWIEIAFHKYSVAKDWGSQIELWGGRADKPHTLKRNGNKWLLRAKNLPIACLDHILNANIGQSPQAPSRTVS